MKELLLFWLTFERAVTRRDYLRHGLALVCLKFGVDALLVGVATGSLWLPTDYLLSVPLLVSSRLASAPSWLPTVLALWTLPFLWIGMTMTVRRLLDAGWSAWWSLLFFVPLASWLLLAVLALAPSADARPGEPRAEPGGERIPSALLSMVLGASLGLALSWIAVLWLNSYGLALFMGTPFVVGVVTAYALRRRYRASVKETFEVVVMTVLLVSGAAFAVGFEGAVCLLMMAPLALVLALMGGLVGRRLAMAGEGPLGGALLVALVVPGGAVLETGAGATAHLREVSSSVVIEAPPDEVWEEVIAFSPIPEPTSLLFRLGVAYPTHAEIEGDGVGAIRYCVFSTGAFVEPITAWEPGVRLAFDVASSPPPLRELSIREIAPPHLEGYLRPRAGEFRLIPIEGGRTRLEGSTWYEQRLRPEGYWVVFSDRIIAGIHERVLEHIRSEVERGR